jgi:hypothetical protein
VWASWRVASKKVQKKKKKAKKKPGACHLGFGCERGTAHPCIPLPVKTRYYNMRWMLACVPQAGRRQLLIKTKTK